LYVNTIQIVRHFGNDFVKNYVNQVYVRKVG
jgi:hypothetical protein